MQRIFGEIVAWFQSQDIEIKLDAKLTKSLSGFIGDGEICSRCVVG